MKEDEEDDGFYGYVPSVIDLGWGLTVGCAICLLVAYLVVLPLLVIWGNRREEKRKTACTSDIVFEDESINKSSLQGKRMGNFRTSESGYDDGQSEISYRSATSSVISSALAAVLDNPRAPRTKSSRKRRRMKDRQLQEADFALQRNQNDSEMLQLLQAIHPGATVSDSAPVLKCSGSKGNNSEYDDEDEFFDTISRPDFLLHDNDEPAAAHQPVKLQKSRVLYDDFDFLGTLDALATIASWDLELKRIIKLSIPFCTQALITGLTDTLNVAVIGKLIGTNEVSAYVIVNLLVELSSEFVGGFHEALATLCSQAIGAENKFLAGQYVQIAVVLYIICFMPFMIIWAIYMESVLHWFGFDKEVIDIGIQYAYILIVDLLIDGIGEGIHSLLDVAGYENYSTMIGASEELTAFVTLLLVGLFASPDLVTVGLIQLGIGLLFLAMNIAIIYWKGWFLPYRRGMIGSFAFQNGKTVWLTCRTALSLSLGMLLTDGEWEILTLMASFMGPAEVAAFGLLGTIWDASNELFDGISDASEVRCAFLLGSGEPQRARISSYKSIMVCLFSSLFLVSLLYIAGDDLPTWLTNDPTLQHILKSLLPLFGIGNIVMAMDTLAWTLLGSQGRYRLATAIVCVVSWLVTLPLAALFTLQFNMDLTGQITAMIIGYLVTGVIHFYFLFRSNWSELSLQVMEDNEAVRLQTAETRIPTDDVEEPTVPLGSSMITTTNSSKTPVQQVTESSAGSSGGSAHASMVVSPVGASTY